MWEGSHLEQSFSTNVNGNPGCSYGNVMLQVICVFKTSLSLFELSSQDLGISESFKKQLTSCRRVSWRYESMMIEICLERHSDSQVLRSAKGERQCCDNYCFTDHSVSFGVLFPLNFANVISGLDQESCAFCKQKAKKHAMYAWGKGWVS